MERSHQPLAHVHVLFVIQEVVQVLTVLLVISVYQEDTQRVLEDVKIAHQEHIHQVLGHHHAYHVDVVKKQV